MSKFKILWIDDQLDKIALEIDRVEKMISAKGYTCCIHTIDKVSTGEMTTGLPFIDKLKSREFDLLFIDYRLSRHVLGSQIISEIRNKNNIYVDIIFYSTDKDDLIKEVVDSYSGAILNYLDDVHIIPLDDSDFDEKVEKVVDKIIGSWYNANSIRGIVISKTSKFESLVNEIVLNQYTRSSNKLTEVIREKKNNVTSDFTSKWTDTINADDPAKYILERPVQFNWNVKKLLFDTLITEGIISIDDDNFTQYIKKIFDLRNDFAHCKAKIENGVLVLHKGSKTKEYGESEISEIRTEINAIEDVLLKLLNRE